MYADWSTILRLIKIIAQCQLKQDRSLCARRRVAMLRRQVLRFPNINHQRIGDQRVRSLDSKHPTNSCKQQAILDQFCGNSDHASNYGLAWHHEVDPYATKTCYRMRKILTPSVETRSTHYNLRNIKATAVLPSSSSKVQADP